MQDLERGTLWFTILGMLKKKKSKRKVSDTGTITFQRCIRYVVVNAQAFFFAKPQLDYTCESSYACRENIFTEVLDIVTNFTVNV